LHIGNSYTADAGTVFALVVGQECGGGVEFDVCALWYVLMTWKEVRRGTKRANDGKERIG
jgi:hypothetical protein